MKIKKEERQRQQNKRYKTLIKNSFKEVERIVSSSTSSGKNDKEIIGNLQIASRNAQKIVDKASQRGLIHKKNASRKVRRISGIVNLFKNREESIS